MRLTASIAFVLGSLIATPLLAATAELIQGEAFINRGQGYRPLAGSTQARAGDTVMARRDGHARIIYPDGCVVEVYPGTVVAVEDDRSLRRCRRAGGFLRDMTPFWIGGAIVGTAFAISVSDDDGGRPRPPRPASP